MDTPRPSPRTNRTRRVPHHHHYPPSYLSPDAPPTVQTSARPRVALHTPLGALPSIPATLPRHLAPTRAPPGCLRRRKNLHQVLCEATHPRTARGRAQVPAAVLRGRLEAHYWFLVAQTPPSPRPSYKADTPRPSPRTNRTRRVPHPVLIGHAASLTPSRAPRPGVGCGDSATLLFGHRLWEMTLGNDFGGKPRRGKESKWGGRRPRRAPASAFCTRRARVKFPRTTLHV